MPRRSPYTKVFKENQIREDRVKGMGDVVFKGMQCLNSKCEEFFFTRKDEIGEDFEIKCPKCGYTLKSGEETKFYDYKLKNTKTNKLIEKGSFTILHDDYVKEAQEYKYCIICNTLKFLDFFDKHSSRKSGRQGECRLCKAVYNSIKNQTRITDQHREASQKRRMYLNLSGGKKINSKKIYERFNHKCFKCGEDLQDKSAKEKPLDHTLPIYYLWPLTEDNATLLCKRHNAEKAGKWPSKYYTDKELKRLSLITGIKYDVLVGEPHYNPSAMKKLKNSNVVDELLTKYSAYIDEIIKLRNRIKHDTNFDFFTKSKLISQVHIKEADRRYKQLYGDK